jgi:hypothetical protein
MAENIKQYFFSHKAIAEDLVKRQGLHEGHWMLTVELGLKGTNVQTDTDRGAYLAPAGLIIISGIGLSRVKEENDLSVDAAKVNPPRALPRKSTKRSRKKGAK